MVEEQHGPLSRMFGTFYPKDYLVAVLESDEAAAGAVQALRQGGWGADDARAFPPSVVLANHEAYLAQRGPLETLAATFASDEKIALDQYIDEAKRGRHFVTAHAESAERAEQAADILAGFGAFGMRHYGEAMLREITTRKE
jgi:hypothetical protein